MTNATLVKYLKINSFQKRARCIPKLKSIAALIDAVYSC